MTKEWEVNVPIYQGAGPKARRYRLRLLAVTLQWKMRQEEAAQVGRWRVMSGP